MKKLLFILTLTLNFNAYAASEGWKDCDEDGTAACEYQIKNGVLTVRGTGENGAGTIPDYTRDCTMTRYHECTTTSPFRWDEEASSVHTINIEKGITSIGAEAFEDMQMTSVNLSAGLLSIGDLAFIECENLSGIDLPEGLLNIGISSFSGVTLESIVIPSSVTVVADSAFNRNSELKSLVVGENTALNEGIFMKWDGTAAIDLNEFKLYCPVSNTSCAASLQSTGATNEEIGQILTSYTKDGNGFYQIGDSLYANADLMTHGAACDDAANCQTILDDDEQGKPFEVGGKYYATLDLFANGAACTDKKNCEEILASNGGPFKVGSKIYNSMADFANGNNIKFRIYTIEEANAVAGTKNRVSIRYR